MTATITAADPITMARAETPKTLAERILAITAEMPRIKATGKSPFSKEPALSIEDVEDAVRPLLIKHGVLIHFRTRQLVRADKEWVAEVTAVVQDARLEIHGETYSGSMGWHDDWADSGSTPAAAYSFARKSYLKQLFHIAGEDDTAQNGQSATTAAAAPRNGTPAAPSPSRPKVISREPVLDDDDRVRMCPDCGKGGLELVTWDNHQSAITCSEWKNGCKHREAVPDQTPIPY